MRLRSQTRESGRASLRQKEAKASSSNGKSSRSKSHDNRKRKTHKKHYVKKRKDNKTSKTNVKESSEVAGSSRDSSTEPGKSTGKIRPRKRNLCSACCEGLKRRKTDDHERRRSDRLVVKNYKLPFEQLPVVVKLHIFKYLSPQNRGTVALVCKEWANLLRSPRLWSRLDLSCFDPPEKKVKHYPNMKPFQFKWFTTIQDYNAYKDRMDIFFEFLAVVQPRLRSLSFQFDVGNEMDDWLLKISDFLDNCQCRDLTKLRVNWTETPVQPPCMRSFCCLFNKVRLMLRQHLERTPYFHDFLEKITSCIPNLQNLTMPFEWSPRSVLLLSRFTNLRSLTLKCYVNMHNLSQDLLDALLRAMPKLQYLSLEIVILTYSSKKLYRKKHSDLQTLDLSGSKGFFLSSLVTPQLRVLRTHRHPWRGPLVASRTNTIPCLYDLVRHDAPMLTHINKHKLHAYWLDFMYDELDTCLENLCPCKYHRVEANA